MLEPIPLRRRRDRRGRGLRGPLAPASVPLSRTRAEQFDDLVLDAVEHLEGRWAEQLRGVEFAVEEVPPPPASYLPGTTVDDEADEAVPLARLVPAQGKGLRPRVVVHRRAIEARASHPEERAELVLDVVVHEVARLLGLDPSVIDPEGHA